MPVLTALVPSVIVRLLVLAFTMPEVIFSALVAFKSLLSVTPVLLLIVKLLTVLVVGVVAKALVTCAEIPLNS